MSNEQQKSNRVVREWSVQKADWTYAVYVTTQLAGEEKSVTRYTGDRDWAEKNASHFEVEIEQEPPVAADEDDLLIEAIKLVVDSRFASVSMLQRKLRISFAKAGRLLDQMERYSIVSGAEGSAPRQVLIGGEGINVLLDLIKRGRREDDS